MVCIGVTPGTNNAVISSQTPDTFGFPGPTPTITASSSGLNAIVWALETSQSGANSAPTGPAVLRAYDATNLSTKLYTSFKLAADTGAKRSEIHGAAGRQRPGLCGRSQVDGGLRTAALSPTL